MTWKGNPVDKVQVLAKAQVPVVFVVEGSDQIVPVDENALVIEKRYNEAVTKGGIQLKVIHKLQLKVIHKPGVGHHPHGLSECTILLTPCYFTSCGAFYRCAHWVWLMIRIAEKLGFMKVRAVMVCARVGIGRKVGHKKPCIPANFQ